ncbi:MAG: hypothetical protein ACSHYB_09160 [Roseibacillus sp.]
MPNQPSIGLGIVSWKSHDTFRPVLESHREANLWSHVDQSLIWFQDQSEEDKELAREFDLACAGGPNVGIAEGYACLAERLDTDLILLTENDCPSLLDSAKIDFQLERARRLFAEDQLDILRLRHRWETGEGFRYGKYLGFYAIQSLHPDFTSYASLKKAEQSTLRRSLRQTFKPTRARSLQGRAIYLEKEPHLVHPNAISKMDSEEELYLTDSRFLNWTNQSVLLPRQLLLDTLLPYVRAHPSSRTSNGFQSPERPLNSPWWHQQQFRIAVGLGLFGHKRVDGSWRPNHPTRRDSAAPNLEPSN